MPCMRCGSWTHDTDRCLHPDPSSVERIKPAPKPERVLRIVMKNGFWIDSVVPEEFSLPGYVTTLRAMGYMLTEEFYAQLEEIQSLFVYCKDSPPKPEGGVVLQFPKGPAA